MTTDSTTSHYDRDSFWEFLDRLPGARALRNFSIGRRLVVGFGILVVFTLLVVAFSYLGNQNATVTIDRTGDVRVPTALASSQAQADLLRMLGDVRGYLALGQGEYRESYNQSRQAFEADLAELERLSPDLSPQNKQRLTELKIAFAEWSELPEQLFDLRDDQLEREPAYRILATEGILLGGQVLIDVSGLIQSQGQREPTVANIERLADMAEFQGTFASMLSGLRGYVTTRNRNFKGEYEANLTVNGIAWDRLIENKDALTPNQQLVLANISDNRDGFLKLPDNIFEVLESDRFREDLYLFSTEAVPRTEKMQLLLADMTLDQQALLQTDLNRGRTGLALANRQTLTAGIIALVLAVALAVLFRENIVGPIRRLTGVAEDIRGGDLEAQATVESGDEIGALAVTFNNMTSQLRSTLFQVRKEKKRADDLLNVVIPIGVELSSEKDFNRLLESMLVEAKAFCHANAGALYLRPTNAEHLRLSILHNSAHDIAMGGTTGMNIPLAPIPLRDQTDQPNHRNVVTHVALTGHTVNIADTTVEIEEFDFPAPENSEGQDDYMFATSMLAFPLKNSEGQILGVMQLMDAQDPGSNQIIRFDDNLQQMMESFSSLAAAALVAYLREQSLRKEIQQLRIEIDETKRQQQVSEIVDTDFFSDLQARAQEIRNRGRRSKRSDKSDDTE